MAKTIRKPKTADRTARNMFRTRNDRKQAKQALAELKRK